MSSYLNIYIKPEGVDKKIHVLTFSRSSGVYQFFWENNLSCYAYKGDFSKEKPEETYKELDVKELDSAISSFQEEILKGEKRLLTMKSLKSKSDIEDIISFEEYLEEEKDTLNCVKLISRMADYDYNDIEAIYSNYD